MEGDSLFPPLVTQIDGGFVLDQHFQGGRLRISPLNLSGAAEELEKRPTHTSKCLEKFKSN